MGEEKRSHRRSPRSTGKRVSVEDRVKAFKLFAQGYLLKDIATELNVHVNTVKRFRTEDEWQKRVDQIYDEVLDRCELDLVKSVEESLRTVQTFKLKLKHRILTIPANAIPITLITHLRDLHDLEQDLMGQLVASKDSGELSFYSEEQLEGCIRAENKGESSGREGS